VIEWLNENVGAVQAAATVVLVCVTGYYAWKTKRLVESSNAQGDAMKDVAEAMRATAEATALQHSLQFAERYDREFRKVREAASRLRRTMRQTLEERAPRRGHPDVRPGKVVSTLRMFGTELDRIVGTLPDPFMQQVRVAISEARRVADELENGALPVEDAATQGRQIAGVGDEAERLIGSRGAE
jgi:hypothetical protein